MHTIGVIGVGRVGRIIAEELHRTGIGKVQIADISREALDRVSGPSPSEHTLLANDTSLALSKFISQSDYIINCTPGFLGYSVLQNVILAGKCAVDISFFPEDSNPLHELALKHKAEVWFDMGLAPGMSNLVAGLFAQKIPNCEEISLYVGGLPVERVFPYEYRAVFSPTDVIEEYTRPARIVREGVVRSLPALSEPEFLEVPKIGTLEAFLTDGLRSLIDNLSIPNMREMTLRYPGHREFMLRLREGGFFSDDTLQNSGMTARQATEQVLLKGWHMADTDADCTVFVGIGKNLDSEHRISMIDYRDPVTSYTSMARTTGFVAAAIASFLITNGKIRGSGVFAPEKLVDHPEALAYLNRYLLERNVAYMGLEGLI